jgi:hypothetical protein
MSSRMPAEERRAAIDGVEGIDDYAVESCRLNGRP